MEQLGHIVAHPILGGLYHRHTPEYSQATAIFVSLDRPASQDIDVRRL